MTLMVRRDLSLQNRIHAGYRKFQFNILGFIGIANGDRFMRYIRDVRKFRSAPALPASVVRKLSIQS
jgi:hypothetical protein